MIHWSNAQQMVLKQYWQIIWRRAWIPLLLVGVVAVVSLLTRQTASPTYTSAIRFTIGVKPQEMADQYNYDGYYAWVASEYLADDMTVIVQSQAFANDINARLAELGSEVRIPPGIINGVTFGEKQHRIIRLNISWGNPEELLEIGRAIIVAMEEESPKYVTQLGTADALITAIDEPSAPVAIPPSLTQRLDLPVRLLLALAAGLAFAFLLEYLDDRLRDRSELEEMGIAVLAEVPKK